MTSPKIITLDIETSPIVAFCWSLWKQNISLNQIIEDWSILAFAAKTLGEEAVRYHDVSDQENLRDDEWLVRKIWDELDAADIVITQNGIRFDHRKINARFIQLGLPPPSPYKMIDTKVEASKAAMFTSNKLEWLAAILTDTPKDKHKEFPGFELWTECLRKNPRAWAEMKAYNIPDVIATENLYLALRPYIVGHPNVNVYKDQEVRACPNCGSEHVVQRGYRFTQTGKYTRYQCRDCNAWSRSGFTENTVAVRKALLRN